MTPLPTTTSHYSSSTNNTHLSGASPQHKRHAPCTPRPGSPQHKRHAPCMPRPGSPQHKRHAPYTPRPGEALLSQYLTDIIDHRNYQESFFFIPELGQNVSQVQRFLDENSTLQALGSKEMCGSSTEPFAPIRER